MVRVPCPSHLGSDKGNPIKRQDKLYKNQHSYSPIASTTFHPPTHAPSLNGNLGHQLTKKKPGMIRIMYENVNSIGSYNGHYKSRLMKKFLLQNSINIAMWSELNICWKKVSQSHRLSQRFQLGEPLRLSVGYNSKEIPAQGSH